MSRFWSVVWFLRCKRLPKVNVWHRMGRIMYTLQFGRKDIKILRILNSLFPTIFFFPGQLWNGIPLVLTYKRLWVYSLLMVYVAPVSRYSGDAFYLVGPKTTGLNKWILRIGKNKYRPLSKNHSRSYGLFLKKNCAYFKTTCLQTFSSSKKKYILFGCDMC